MRDFWQKTKRWFSENKLPVIVLLVTLVFLVVNSYALRREFYYLSLVPLAGLAILLFVRRLEFGLLAIALFTPFAINYDIVKGSQLSMPTEPLLLLFMLIFLFRVLLSRSYDRKIISHPVTLAVLFSLLWMLITSATSELPGVSFKYLLARLWFVIPCFFAAAQIFKNPKRITQFYWCYAVSLLIIIFMTTLKTFSNFSDLQTMHRVMKPFYNDHTAYGVTIAMFVPPAFHYIFENKQLWSWKRLFAIAAFVLLMTGLVLSYSRAAWISVLGAVAVYFAIRFGMKVRRMLLCGAVAIGLFFAYQADVMYKLGKNSQDSSYDIADQIKSISNISTDASNLERLNRWASALRMFDERPVTGWGPGTYQFVYAGYQRSYQLSTISTNAGNLGNAHSEYIGPLSEQGVLGTAAVLLVFGITFVSGVRVYRTLREKDKRMANLALSITLGLLTYYIHGIFNNFLDTDKLSVPFWGFTAVVVAFDVYMCREQEKNDAEAEKIDAE